MCVWMGYSTSLNLKRIGKVPFPFGHFLTVFKVLVNRQLQCALMIIRNNVPKHTKHVQLTGTFCVTFILLKLHFPIALKQFPSSISQFQTESISCNLSQTGLICCGKVQSFSR